jgi:hypothetical protein
MIKTLNIKLQYWSNVTPKTEQEKKYFHHQIEDYKQAITKIQIA